MKKITQLVLILTILTGGLFSLRAQTPSFTTNFNICNINNSWSPQTATAMVTSTVAGATSYSWTATTFTSCPASFTILSASNGSVVAVTYPCALNYTLTCAAYNGTTLISSTSSVVTITTGFGYLSMQPQFSGTICPGGTATISAASTYSTYSISSYTWFGPASVIANTSSVAVTPTINTCYTVAAQLNPSGCIAYSTTCINVNNPPTPTVSISGGAANGTVCSNGLVMIASGAVSYTWLPLNINTAYAYIPSPTSNICYTVIGDNGCGATASAVRCVTAVITATALVVSGSTAICAGNAVTLSATGGTNYQWTTGYGINTTTISTTSSVIVTPTASTCYTVNDFSAPCYITQAHCINVTPNFNPFIGNAQICPGQTATVGYFGPGTYTWTSGASNFTSSSTVALSPTTTTCYSVSGISASNCPVSSIICVTVTSIPVLSISGTTAVCQGWGGSLYATGASSIVWQPGNVQGNNLNIFWNGPSCYTVTGTSGLGCVGTAVQCVTVTPTPSLTSVFSNTSVCMGSSVTLGVSQSAYTWMTINLNTYTYYGSNTGTSTAITPSTSGIYSVSAWFQSSSCFSSYTTNVSLLPLPNVGIAGNNTVCSGSNLVLSGLGAMSYTWSNLSTGGTVTVSPTANTCYSVIGTAPSGCKNVAVKCVTVQTTPMLISPASQTVCRGSSANFTASGANTYSWSTGANTATLNVLSLTGNTYSFAGTGTNGCLGTAFATLTIDTTCSNVWPGDANNDGVVNNSDVLELGLAFSSTGAVRPSASITYVSQFANNWVGNVSTGKNKCHADCNGDGIVNLADTLAISNNFSLTHAFKQAQSSSAPELILSPQLSEAHSGNWNVIDIVLGDNSAPFSQLYGVAFDLDYNEAMMVQDSVKLIYTPSFLNSGNQNIHFAKTVFMNGKLYAASVRTDGANVNGNGKIAELHIKLKDALNEGASFNFGITNGKKISNAAVSGTVSTSNFMNLTVTNIHAGLQDVNARRYFAGFYPNPAKNQLTLISSAGNATSYKVMDVTGRTIYSGSFIQTNTLDISVWIAGVYFVEFEAEKNRSVKKLVIEK